MADVTLGISGSAGTPAAGSVGRAALVKLQSRKVGVGTAAQVLSGQAATGATGTLGFSRGPALTGLSITGQQGTVVYGGQATISWNANTEPDLAGYRVYHDTTSGIYTDVVTLGLVTSYQWGGLTGGQTHYFVVTAFDTSGNESARSVQVSKAF
jgi:hypothetical protein